MTNKHVCDLVDAPATAEQYVAQRLSEADRVAFENHFVTCASCQDEVRLASAVRAAVRTPDRTSIASASGGGARPVRWIGIGVAIAAGIGAIMLFRTAPSPALTSLGSVLEPPVYLGVAVRGTPGRGDSIFDDAMKKYAARNYPDAAVGLRAALAAGQDSVPVEFFLAASLLMSNDSRMAAETFERVATHGDTPYRDEALLYEAKALLRLGRGRDAIEVLSQHKPDDPLMAATFSAFSDSVTRAIAR